MVGMNKPDPMPHVYDWIKFRGWLDSVAPNVADELIDVMQNREARNNSIQSVCLKDFREGYSTGLSPESIAFFEREFGDAEISFHYWW